MLTPHFSGSLIYSAVQVINNTVVLGERELPVIINLSLEVSQVKNWENPTNPTKITFLLLRFLGECYRGIGKKIPNNRIDYISFRGIQILSETQG